MQHMVEQAEEAAVDPPGVMLQSSVTELQPDPGQHVYMMTNSLPRYPITGGKTRKTLELPSKLEALTAEYCQNRNITQREFIIIATIEALARYGYAPEVKGILR